MPRPNGLNRTPEQLREYILARVAVNEAGCWIWQRRKDRYGYGRITFGGNGKYRDFKAHRVAFSAFKERLVDGLELDHLCRVRACCNPDHLEQVTHRENVLRGESPSAQGARRNTCIRGHLLEPRKRAGWRHCRICQDNWHRENRSGTR